MKTFPGSFHAHWFQLFNAVSFQIMMGAPVIVFAKSLGASSTVLGIIASFTPLMTVFQLPAAQHLERYGYREFVLMGWSIRTVFIFVTAIVPVMAFLDNPSKMAVLLAILFVFNLLRGISSTAWMPWMTTLIPEESRGRFLSVDQIFMYAGSLVSLLASAVVMTGQVDPWEYSFVFLISAVGGTLSLYFIKRIPDVAAGESVRRSSQKVPWRAMLAKDRAAILRKLNDLMLANAEDLGVIMTAEQGKPLAEAKGEVAYAASFSEFFADEAIRVYGDTIPQNAAGAASLS